jgi:hypothetical protein
MGTSKDLEPACGRDGTLVERADRDDFGEGAWVRIGVMMWETER